MRVLLTGSTGRLGGAFLSLWKKRDDIEVITLTRSEADLSEPEELRHAIRAEDFDVLINPAAISGLEECADNPYLAKLVNVDSPRVMAEVCSAKGAKLVHFSTDYVFDGELPGRKIENDPIGAVNMYGVTKMAGERHVLDANDDSLICRVSWLFGPTTSERPSHFDNVLDRALSGESQNLIADKFSVPTFTHDVVEWVELLLQHRCSGIYHLCNSGEPESWHSYAEKICTLAQQHGQDLSSDGLIASSIDDAHFFREKRPVHTAMLPARLKDEGIASPRHWLEAAEVYLKIR